MAKSNAGGTPAGRDLDRLRAEEAEALRAMGDPGPDDDEDNALDDEPAADDPDVDAADADDEDAQPDGAGEDDDLDGEEDEGDEPESDEPPEAGEPAPQGQAQPTDSQDDIEERPFRFRADGVERDVPGAIATKHGIVFPGDSFQRHVQPHLADRSAWQRKEQEYRRQIEALRPELNEDVIRAKVLAQTFDAMLEAAEKGDEGPLRDFLLGAAENAERLKLRVENEVLKAQTKARTDRDTAEQTEQAQSEFSQRVETGLAQGLLTVLREEDFQGIDAEEVFEAIRANPYAYVFRPVAGDGSGLDPAQHDFGINLNAMRAYLAPIAKSLRRAQQATAEARRREQARRRNSAATGQGARRAPTAVSRQGSPAVGGKKPRRPKSKAEWEQSIYGAMYGEEIDEE